MHTCLCELVYDVLVLLSGNKMRLDLPRVKEPAQKGCAGCQPTHAQQTARLHVHLASQTNTFATLRTGQCAKLQCKYTGAFINSPTQVNATPLPIINLLSFHLYMF